MRVRRALREDAPTLRDIYNLEVADSTATFDLVPRTLAEQQDWITARDGAHAALVAVEQAPAGTGEVVLGFGSLSPYRDRPGYATSVEDSVYVDRGHQGKGVGRLLLDALVVTAESHGFHTVLARIVGGHEASLALHRGAGFDVIGTEREVGRKKGRWLDVVIMQRLLGPPDQPRR